MRVLVSYRPLAQIIARRAVPDAILRDGRLLPTEARVNPVKAPNGALKLCQAIDINFSGQRARKHTRVGAALKRKSERLKELAVSARRALDTPSYSARSPRDRRPPR